eukprot:246055_1
MAKKFAKMTDSDLPNEIRRILSLTITRTWKELNRKERDCVANGTVHLLQHDWVEPADIILRNVMPQENTFDNTNDEDIIKYLATPIGKEFIELLSALRRTKSYYQLSITDRLSALHSFWITTIFRIASSVDTNSIDDTLSKAQVPLSSHIHSYLSSYKDDCLASIAPGTQGQTKLVTDMQNTFYVTNVSAAINLPENFVRKLSKDILLLEATRYGIRKHGDAMFKPLMEFVDELIWKSSKDVHEHALRAKKLRKNMEQTVQIHEVCASLWANEKIILQCVDVLSVLKESPIRLSAINREWEVDGSLDVCLVAIIRCLLGELRDILYQGAKEKVDCLVTSVLSPSQSFDDLLKWLDTFQVESTVELREEWNAIRQCISSNTYCNTEPEFVHSLLPSLENKLQLIRKKTSPMPIKTMTATIIGQSWVNLSNKQQQSVQSACDELIQQREFDIAASIINAIMESADIYSKDKTAADIVVYLASASGGEILKLLHRYKDHKELAIQCHINAFLQFWKQTLSNVDVIVNHAGCINTMVHKFGGIVPKNVPPYSNQNEGFFSMDQDDEKNINAANVIIDDSTKSTLNTHTLRLKEWHKDEAALQTICESTDSINNYHFEDEKQDIDSTQWELLLHQRSKCNDLIHTQSERLESLPQNVRELFVKQTAIKNALKQCEMEAKQHQDMMEQMKRQFSECHTKRKDLQRALVNTYKQFSDEMNKENILLQQQKQLKERMDHGGTISSIGKRQYHHSANIITSYQLYQKNTRIFMQKVQDKLQDECSEREKVWWEWTAHDCFIWFRYTLEWFKEETIPRAIDINTIQENMDQLGLTGRMLESIQKDQLSEIGFGFKQMDVLYPAIKHLCSSYPAPKMNENDKDRTHQTDVEGMIEETCNNNVDIPDRFKCTLTNQIMDHPVIAFDGRTYDKNAIIVYLKQHHKSPITDEPCVGDDEMSFMLFDDEKLKREINIFKKDNNL